MAYLAFIGLESDNRFTTVIADQSGMIGPFDVINIDTGTQQQINVRDSWQAQLQLNMRFDRHEMIVGTSNYIGKNDVRRSEDNINSFFIVGDPSMRDPPKLQVK